VGRDNDALNAGFDAVEFEIGLGHVGVIAAPDEEAIPLP
jgi:hypothetical protein